MSSTHLFFSVGLLLLIAVLGIDVPLAHAGDAGQPRDAGAAASGRSGVKVWVYFSDHGESSEAELRNMLSRVRIGERALDRRLRRSRLTGPDIHDLQVNPAYVDALSRLGCEVRHRSRYMNAVSVRADAGQVRAITRLPFVARVDRVRTGKRALPDINQSARDTVRGVPRADETLDYGISEHQHQMINTKPLHEQGYTGAGVRVAVLDTGFFISHNGLSHLNLIAQWDFINNDGITTDEFRETEGQMGHGTSSLGVIAGYLPGKTIGVAWEAEYILAKTERLLEEVQAEEDDYVAALEWADGLGADVVSSSLGYFYWYEHEDLDGDTAVITRAVDIAASRGILVVTAAGNERNSAWGTLIVPADADSAIAVGAVDPGGILASFSSPGPTRDGRIKPDVVAQGLLVATLSWMYADNIAGFTGTSASAPLVAGAAALILQKNPDWSPIDVRDALRATASRADSPDNDYGWGIIDAYAAANRVTAVSVAVDVRPGSCENTFNPKSRGVLPVLIPGGDHLDVHEIDVQSVRLGGAAALSARVADIGGAGGCDGQSPDGWDDLWLKIDSQELAASAAPAAKGGAVTLELTGELYDGTPLEGEAVVRIVGKPDGPVRNETAAGATGLGPAVPNPFNPVTRISYRLARSGPVELTVYDVRGRLVETLVDAERPAGEHTTGWNASAHPSGVYYYRLRAGGVDQTRKLLLLK
jgi:hypothetical protein